MTSDPTRSGVPFSVPPGVLHTPGGVGQTLNRVGQNVGHPWDTFGENPPTTRVLAVPFPEPEWDTVGHFVSHFQNLNGTVSV